MRFLPRGHCHPQGTASPGQEGGGPTGHVLLYLQNPPSLFCWEVFLGTRGCPACVRDPLVMWPSEIHPGAPGRPRSRQQPDGLVLLDGEGEKRNQLVPVGGAGLILYLVGLSC